MSDAAIALARPVVRTRLRARLGVALLVLGLLVAAAPGLAAGDDFLPRMWMRSGTVIITSPAGALDLSGTQPAQVTVSGGEAIPSQDGRYGTVLTKSNLRISYWPLGPSSLAALVQCEPGWTAAAIALLSMVPLYGWWRHGGLSFGRAAGIAACVAAAAGVCALVLVVENHRPHGGAWWTVPLGAALMGAAFVVAPAPERRGDE